jgi:putative ABC transport system permease protein
VSISVTGTVRSLLKNRLQALLALCGMSVAIAMVIIVTGLGLGAHRRIESQLRSAGPTLITIRSGNFTPLGAITTGEEDSSGGEVGQGMDSQSGAVNPADVGGVPAYEIKRAVRKTRYRVPPTPLGDADLVLLRSGIADLNAVAAGMDGNVSLAPDSATLANVVHVYGFEPAWPEMAGWRLAAGRWISESEHEQGGPVAMLTAAAARRLWPDTPAPLGHILAFAGTAVRIVGILAPDADANAAVVPAVYVPLALARKLLHRTDYDLITVRADSVEVTTSLAQRIRQRLRTAHHLAADTVDDFRVQTQSLAAMPSMGLNPRTARSVHSNLANLDRVSYAQLARSLRGAGRTFDLLLAGGAAVSLLVGGIGVMNIMLVSVTARTREIGLRMAVGARTRDVLLQFMAEAILLASLGGLLGLALGACGLAAIRFGLHWATAISAPMFALGLLVAAATGVIFGYGPARRAAVLDPVIALRSE